MASAWKPDEMRLIQFMKRNPEYIRYEDYRNQHKGSVDVMWDKISKTINVPVKEVREKWKRIKRNYFEHLRRKVAGSKSKTKFLAHNKYSDGNLSFLNIYCKAINTDLQEEPVVVIDSDENSKENDFFTLDLTMIDELLASRKQEDIAMSYLDTILSRVCKRIDETLLAYEYIPHSPVTANLDEMETSSLISDDSDSKNSSNSEEQSQPHEASPSTVEPINDTNEMETLFDIHQSCESNLIFYRKLGHYVERLPKDRQEEIRLKICCIVMEAELNEDE